MVAGFGFKALPLGLRVAAQVDGFGFRLRRASIRTCMGIIQRCRGLEKQLAVPPWPSPY